jgi:hypothetical protein
MGCYYAVEVAGPEAIMTTILEPTGHHATEVVGVEAIVSMIPELMGCCTYWMCDPFCFCTIVPPLH